MKSYIFWKRRQLRRRGLTPKFILMAPKKKEKFFKTSQKTTPKNTIPSGPSDPPSEVAVTKVKMAEPLVKEFAMVKSDVALPHRGKPFEWTVDHWWKALGRTKEEEELGIVWDTAIQRLNMPEGVNPDNLFQEKRREKDKNG
ncbi:hypothetical protein R1sor_016575 [Riccia sorocarpa]|uniref:Uncharacterized protein n=1 Tax=Riccia sorocarpa TaxID=122646 RepID=A0ABD3HJI7_9MARC